MVRSAPGRGREDEQGRGADATVASFRETQGKGADASYSSTETPRCFTSDFAQRGRQIRLELIF